MLGIFLYLTGNILISLSVVVISRNKENATRKRISYVFFGLGNVITFVSSGMDKQNVLAGLISVQFVVFFIFSKKWDLMGTMATIFIISGNIFIIFTNRDESYSIISPGDLNIYIKNGPFLFYMVCSILVNILIYVFLHFIAHPRIEAIYGYRKHLEFYFKKEHDFVIDGTIGQSHGERGE